jgi:hypothetical protein
MSKKFYLSALGVVLTQAVGGFNLTDYIALEGNFSCIYIYIYIYISCVKLKIEIAYGMLTIKT